MLSRAQQARFAVWLARPQLVLFFVGVMGVAVALNFALMIATLVHPTLAVGHTPWGFVAATAINLAVLTARGQVLGRGWLPVSLADIERGPLKEAWATPEQARVLLQRVRAHGWLQWKDAQDLLPSDDTWMLSFQRWQPEKDRVTNRWSLRKLAAATAPVARRAEYADHVGETQAQPMRARERHRS